MSHSLFRPDNHIRPQHAVAQLPLTVPVPPERARATITNPAARQPTNQRQNDSTTIPTAPRPSTTPNSGTKKRYKFASDRLGKNVSAACNRFEQSKSWREFVNETRGPSHIHENVKQVPHPAGPLLDRIRRHGVPVVTSDLPEDDVVQQARLKRGPHKSACDHAEFVREEMADFSDKGFWTILPYDMVKHLDNLRLAPLGAIPQRDRRPRLIVNLSFYGLNDVTVRLSPAEAMQFGRTLKRIMYRIRHANPKFGPVYLNKIDISDGFYRVPLNADMALKLACMLPREPGEPPLVAIPLALPMGWVESPPAFCAVTETIADMANARMHLKYAPPHRLEADADTKPPAEPTEAKKAATKPIEPTAPTEAKKAPTKPFEPENFVPGATPATAPIEAKKAPTEPFDQANGVPEPNPATQPTEATTPVPDPTPTPEPTTAVPSLPTPAPTTRQPLEKPLNYVDLYVDDFCNLIQGDQRRRRMARRVLFHTIDEVLKPLDPAHKFHQEPTSVKKLRKGDGYWETRKIILGWLIDTINQTIELPAHRIARLQEIFDSLRGVKRVAVKKWHKVLGELRSMVMAIPGGQGLFSTLQAGFKHSDRHRIRIDRCVRENLDDMEILAKSLADRPTRLAEIVPDDPVGIGASDAAGPGMGGVVFAQDLAPLLWRAPFPDHIQQRLVSSNNRDGDLTNSDLELAGVVAQQDIAAQHWDLRESTISVLNDNTPAISRSTKGSVTSKGAAAYLLRIASLHQRHHRYLATYDHISGIANAMADDCSRLWHLDDSQFVAYFNQVYPQKLPWQFVPLRSSMSSALISALQTKRVDPQSYLNVPDHRTAPGKSGSISATSTTSTPFWKRSKTQKPTSKSLANVTATGDEPKMVNPSELAQWRTPYVQSARRWPAWGPKTCA
jgi:hypothetical protein